MGDCDTGIIADDVLQLDQLLQQLSLACKTSRDASGVLHDTIYFCAVVPLLLASDVKQFSVTAVKAPAAAACSAPPRIHLAQQYTSSSCALQAVREDKPQSKCLEAKGYLHC